MGNGQWIWDSIPCVNNPEYILFRKTVQMKKLPRSLMLYITADSRYIVYLNGKVMARGPARSDSSVRYVDEVNIASNLRTGENILAVAVIHYPLNNFEANEFKTGPCSVVSSAHGGLLIYGDARFETNESYRCAKLEAYTFRPAQAEYIGYYEEVDGRRYPFGWMYSGYDDSNWSPAVSVADNVPFIRGGLTNVWQTRPRNIPMPYEKERTFTAVLRSDISGADDILKDGVEIPAGFAGCIEIEAETYTTGFVCLEVEGGVGTRVELIYAESYMYDEKGQSGLKRGRRDFHTESSYLCGDSDVYVAGYGLQKYAPFHYRAFRFIKLNIKVQDSPICIRVLPYIETGYPLKEQSAFECDDLFYDRMWDVSLRTLRCCMYETYIDCPYYEQMQYVMDTKLEALYTYSVSRDNRLASKAIRDFYNAQLPNGLIPCNSPSRITQIIPGFSLYWIFIVEDHFKYFGDTEIVREVFPAIEKVLYYFEKCLNEQFLLKNTGFWQFVDWTSDWEGGNPLNSSDQVHFIYSMMFVSALISASRLADSLSRHDIAAEYKSLAYKISQSINTYGYDMKDDLYLDTEDKSEKSQHAQIWAVLSGIISGKDARSLMLRAINHHKLAECSFSMEHFMFRAMETAGLYRQTKQLWDRRRELMAMDITTWPEDPVSMRSDCHAWSATPLYEFITCGLGVRPETDGFNKVRVAPKMLWLKRCSGSAVTGNGRIDVEWRINEGVFMITIRSEQPTSVVLEMPDSSEFEFILHGEETYKCTMLTPEHIKEKITIVM